MLPNFCAGRGFDARNNFDKYVNDGRGRDDVKRTGVLSRTSNANKNALDNRNNDEKNRLKNLSLKYFPGTNPDYALNGPMPPPDGKNNAHSNSGADGRYKDTKMLYEKDYLTTINLIIGILISLSVIAKKSN